MMTSMKVSCLQGKDTDATVTSTLSRVPSAPSPPSLPISASSPVTAEVSLFLGAEEGRLRARGLGCLGDMLGNLKSLFGHGTVPWVFIS